MSIDLDLRVKELLANHPIHEILRSLGNQIEAMGTISDRSCKILAADLRTIEDRFSKESLAEAQEWLTKRV